MRAVPTINFGRYKRGVEDEFPDDTRTGILIQRGIIWPAKGESFTGPARGESTYVAPVVWSAEPSAVATVPVPDDDEDLDDTGSAVPDGELLAGD